MNSLFSKLNFAKFLLVLISLASIYSTRVLDFGDQFTMIFIASASFLLIAFLAGGHKTWFGRFLITGLFCCFLGDVLGPGDFLLGLYAFFAAHLFLITAFALRGINNRYFLSALFVFGFITTFAIVGFYSHIPENERFPVIAYAMIITLMMLFAAGTFGHRKTAGAVILITGATLFYLSDLLLAGWHFMGDQFPYGHLCYFLYYPGVILLAFSAGDGK